MKFLNKNINEAKYNQPHTTLELKSNATPRLFSLTVVVYHLQKVSGKSGWKVNGTHIFESFRRKISGSNRTSEKVVLFFRTECSKRKFVFHFFKAIFGTSFRLSHMQAQQQSWRIKGTLQSWIQIFTNVHLVICSPNIWNFFACLQLDTSSFLLFRVAIFGLQII